MSPEKGAGDVEMAEEQDSTNGSPVKTPSPTVSDPSFIKAGLKFKPKPE